MTSFDFPYMFKDLLHTTWGDPAKTNKSSCYIAFTFRVVTERLFYMEQDVKNTFLSLLNLKG